ncbi:unnamed protein product [Echinostoma caproni]|uniref:DUF7041 domain-containing protein n=1 Tax=Echinostoma caproni TaxID=27848 RepID=A0A183BGH5_9TREM|nr:unnamed protein product [Echinostoma caproni]
MEQSKLDLEDLPTSSHIKLPVFGINNPRLWFVQAKAHFRAHRIRSQKLIYSHIVTSLPTDIAEQVFEFITTMPETDPYTQLKEALITRTAVSDERRLDELFKDLEIGDRTPSQLLRHMRQPWFLHLNYPASPT